MINIISVDFRAEVVQQLQQQAIQQRVTSPISRPGSSDGSTTVSATSSPGIDQQEQEELNALYQVMQKPFNWLLNDWIVKLKRLP